jgi:hypothetical protein
MRLEEHPNSAGRWEDWQRKRDKYNEHQENCSKSIKDGDNHRAQESGTMAEVIDEVGLNPRGRAKRICDGTVRIEKWVDPESEENCSYFKQKEM